MESETPPPLKKPRIIKESNLNFSECVREFQLPQQYPSTVSEYTKQSVGEISIAGEKSLARTVKHIPKVRILNNGGLQKMQARGDNLREVKLKVNKGHEKKIRAGILPVSKSNSIPRSNNTSESISLLLDKHKNSESSNSKLQLSNNAHFQFQFSNKTNSITGINTNLAQLVNTAKTTTSSIIKSNIRPKPRIVQNFLLDNSNSLFSKTNKSPQASFTTLPNGPKIVIIDRNSRSLVQKPKTLSPTQNSLLDNKILQTTDNNFVIKTTPIINSFVKKADGECIELSKNKKNIFEISIDEPTGSVTALSKTSIDTNKTNEPQNKTTVKQSRKQDFKDIKKDFLPITEELTIDDTPEKPKPKTKSKSKFSNISPEDLITDDMVWVTNEDDIENSSYYDASPIRDADNVDDCIIYDSIRDASIVDETENSNKEEEIITTEEKVNAKDDLSEKYKILEKAVLSVQDENLRELALKALKECGVKIKKTVPVTRSQPTRTIAESQTQTEVFSLLDKGKLIEVSELNENIKRLSLNHKVIRQSIPRNYQRIELIESDIKNDFDKMLEKSFPDNKNIIEIKETLTNTKSYLARQILRKLRIDYESMKNYDCDGYLGIHNAVLSNSLYQVQRFLFILKIAKYHIDVPTEDDQTSLELAIECDIDPSIIKILLEAGAQPVSSKPAHDSALIIAAKKSSPILPVLLSFISEENRSLINCKDSNGYAAIHYCSLHGNLEGVTNLIKYNADVDIQEDRSGRTPLFFALETKLETKIEPELKDRKKENIYDDIALKLLASGANSSIQTFSKHSVLSFIEEIKSHSLRVAINKAAK